MIYPEWCRSCKYIPPLQCLATLLQRRHQPLADYLDALDYVHQIKQGKDMVQWFRSQGRGYQTKMNAVLRSFYEAHRNEG